MDKQTAIAYLQVAKGIMTYSKNDESLDNEGREGIDKINEAIDAGIDALKNQLAIYYLDETGGTDNVKRD